MRVPPSDRCTDGGASGCSRPDDIRRTASRCAGRYGGTEREAFSGRGALERRTTALEGARRERRGSGRAGARRARRGPRGRRRGVVRRRLAELCHCVPV
jgi:hypothetical protein